MPAAEIERALLLVMRRGSLRVAVCLVWRRPTGVPPGPEHGVPPAGADRLGYATSFDHLFVIDPSAGTIARRTFSNTHTTVQSTATVGNNSHVRGLDITVTGSS